MFPTVTFSHMIDRVPHDLVGPHNSSILLTSTNTLCSSHPSLHRVFFFQSMHAFISMFIQKSFLFLQISSHFQHPTLLLHALLYPLRPRSDVTFPRQPTWGLLGHPCSVLIWHNKNTSTTDCHYLFLCVFSPYFCKMHINIHSHTLAHTYSHRHRDTHQIKVKTFSLLFEKYPSHLTE